MKTGQKGFVLIAVIWVLAILTVLAIGFGRRALLDQRAAALHIDHTRAQYYARGATEYGIVYLRNQAVIEAAMEQAGGDTRFNIYQVQDNLLKQPGFYDAGDPSLMADDEAKFTLEDEEGRISLNTAPEKLLENVEGLSFTTVDAILRRRGGPLDMDKTTPFLSVDELRTLEDFSDAEWYGSQGRIGVRDLFTTYGDGRINVNTAPAEVLQCLPDIDPAVVAAIVTYRQGPDGKLKTADDRRFRNVEEIATATGVNMNDLAAIARFCKFDSQFFRITGFATQRQGKVRAVSSAVVRLANGDATVLDWSEGEFGS